MQVGDIVGGSGEGSGRTAQELKNEVISLGEDGPRLEADGKATGALVSQFSKMGEAPKDSNLEARLMMTDESIQIRTISEAEAQDTEGEERAPPCWDLRTWSASSILKLLIALLVIVGLVVLLVVLPTWEWLEKFSMWAEEHRVEGGVSLALIYAALTVLCFPGSILTVVAGFIFGVPVASVAVVSGASVGMVGSFLLGRYVLREWVATTLVNRHRSVRAVDTVITRSGMKIVFLLRLSPLIPFNALNYVLAATGVTFKDYTIGSVLGILPGTVLFVYIGSTAKSVGDILNGDMDGGVRRQIVFYGGLAFTIILTIVVTRMARKQINIELSQQTEVIEPATVDQHSSSDEMEKGGRPPETQAE